MANAGRFLATVALTALLAASTDLAAPIRPVSDSYFGTIVTDPYRYMETGDPAYTAWRTQQVAATRAFFTKARAQTGIGDDASLGTSIPQLTNLTVVRGHAFFVKSTRDGASLFEASTDGTHLRTVVTSATYNSNHVDAQLGAFCVSNDARLIELHVFGADNRESDVHLVRVADGRDVEAPLTHTVFDYCGFTPNDRQVVYARIGGPAKSLAIPDASFDVLHTLGTPQRSDVVIFGYGISSRVPVAPHAFAFVDTSGSQAVAEVRDVAAGGSQFYAAPLSTVGKPGTPWRPLGTRADGYTDYALHGTTIDLATNAGAPNYAVVRAELIGPFRPRVVLPASPTVVVSGTLDFIPKAGIFALNAAADADYVQLLDHGVARVVRLPYEAKHGETLPVLLPSETVLGIATDQHQPGALIDLTSWTTPGDVYQVYPVARGHVNVRNTDLAARGPGARRVVDHLSAIAADGTSIAVDVVHRPEIALDGSHPTLLRVAGAYGFSLTANYGAVPEAWLDRGGVYAVAHVRGGGELGEAWHRAGMGMQKSNSWNDLIAAAQLLIAKGYTTPKHLALLGSTQSYLGGIAAGVVIGRAIEVRPGLFAAAAIDAPAMDMLRSERTELGRQSVSEFGSVATADGFAALLAMSPYEHVDPTATYPTVLIRSLAGFGLGDDWESAKMVARLQTSVRGQDAAMLDTIDSSRSRAATRADLYAFLLYECGSTRDAQ
jgi:prolyl oligopeptidase